MNELNLGDVFAPFYEEGREDPHAELERVLSKYRNDDGSISPIVLMEDLSPEDQAIVDRCCSSMLSELQAEVTDSQSPASSATFAPDIPPAFGSPIRFDALSLRTAQRTLHHLTHQVDEKPRTKPTHLDLTQLMLSRVVIRKYDGEFYFFTGSVYRHIPSSDLHTFIFEVIPDALQQDGSPRALSNVASFLSAHPGIRVLSTTDSPTRLYFQNGALELPENRLRPVCPQDFFTSYIATDYPVGGTPSCPLFDDFLRTIADGDTTIMETIWEMIGYLIVPGNQAKAFFVLQGVSNSGKSVLGNLIAELLNPAAISHLDIFRLGGRFDLNTLRRARINISMDLSNGCLNRQAISAIKSITGDDGIPLEGKFKDVEFGKLQCKLLFGSNHRLTLAENDEALLNRLVVIPFNHAIPKDRQDKGLLSKLRQEKSAIVVRALEAYRTLATRNFQFLLGASGTGYGICGYAKSGDALELFLENCCTYDRDSITPTAALYESFSKFCTENHYPFPSNITTFSRKINTFCNGKIQNKKARVNGVSCNCYIGIRLVC